MNRIIFTPEQLAELRGDFDILNTVEERLTFWRNRIRFRYSLWLEAAYWNKTDKYFEQSLYDFYIKPTHKEEVERLNLLILEEIKDLDLISHNKQLLDCDRLKMEIDEKIKDSVRAKEILEDELKRLDELIDKNKQKEHGFEPELLYKNNVRDAWTKGFDEYYFYGKEVDFSLVNSITPFIVAVQNGSAIAKYKEHVKKRKDNPSFKKETETTLKQQLLMLRFTGILEQFNDWKQKDRDYFLSVLLNRSSQKIKEAFSDLYRDKIGNEIWTENNLNFLIKHFNKIGLDEEIRKLKKSLEEIKKEVDRIKSEK